MIGIILLMFLITSKITLPLRKLTNSVKIVESGNLDKQIVILNTNDEIGILTHTFEDMRKSLINYIENLKKTAAEKESSETEIKIAASLQSSILHVVDNRFKSNLFDIFIKLVPAKDVSGDFYYIFYLSNKSLALVVADVSGTGIHAAFFMSMAKFAIKNICNTISTPTQGKAL